MARLGHEDRLSVVEHLTELRRRLLVALAIFAGAFTFAWLFNDDVIRIANAPLTASQSPDCERQQADPLAQTTCFQRSVGQAFGALTPALGGLADDVRRLGGDVPPGERAALGERIERLEGAAQATREAAEAAPTSTARNPVTLGVAEPFFQTFTISAYAAIVLSLPFLLWQLYAFLIPAFTPREKRVAIPLLWMVPVLFYAGALFAYFAALPRAVDFLQNFNDDNFDILVQAKDYFRFTAIFVGGIGILFQVPVVVLGISRLGILTARQMRRRRGIVAVLVAVLAAIVTPTPDPVTMLIAMAPLVLLFEGSVALAGVFERRFPVQPRFDVDAWGEAAERTGDAFAEGRGGRDEDGPPGDGPGGGADDPGGPSGNGPDGDGSGGGDPGPDAAAEADLLPWDHDDEPLPEPVGAGRGVEASTGPVGSEADDPRALPHAGGERAAGASPAGPVRADAPPVLPPGLRSG